MTQKSMATLIQLSEAAMPGLSSEEQRAGIVLLRELAKGEPVAVPQFAEALGVPVKEAEALVKGSALRRLIYAGEDGRVVGFWGLSTVRTHHRFTINGRTLWAWCAGDTLFLPEAVGETAVVESRDPDSGELVRLTISPARVEAVEPKDVTVSFLQPDTVDFTSATQIMATACHHIFFFASRASGERWVDKHPGKVLLSLDEAFTLARRLNAQVFGPEMARLR
ncbi:MAG: organomercurial lyase [Gemmatimonadales bacterium]